MKNRLPLAQGRGKGSRGVPAPFRRQHHLENQSTHASLSPADRSTPQPQTVPNTPPDGLSNTPDRVMRSIISQSARVSTTDNECSKEIGEIAFILIISMCVQTLKFRKRSDPKPSRVMLAEPEGQPRAKASSRGGHVRMYPPAKANVFRGPRRMRQYKQS